MSRTILIVDDSKTERVVLSGYLKVEYDLVEAASGEEAIEILRHKFRAISAIVLDIVMPGMDGFETLKVMNDQYGTETGDAMLRHMAQTLSGFVGGIGGLCGRYMADKFAVLYPAAMKDSKEIAENYAAVAAPSCVRQPIRVRIGRYLVSDLTSVSQPA